MDDKRKQNGVGTRTSDGRCEPAPSSIFLRSGLSKDWIHYAASLGRGVFLVTGTLAFSCVAEATPPNTPGTQIIPAQASTIPPNGDLNPIVVAFVDPSPGAGAGLAIGPVKDGRVRFPILNALTNNATIYTLPER